MIILASKSPRRIEILKKLNIEFIIKPSDYDETLINDMDPETRVKKIAFGKANDVYKNNKNDIVIGVDTLVYKNKKFYPKPKNDKELIKFLKEFSDSMHYVYTAICVIANNKIYFGVDKTMVIFNKLDINNIIQYSKTDIAYDKAGGYAIQDDRCKDFIKEINGDIETVIGLPSKILLSILNNINEGCI